jgi:hypothetical protein
MKRSSILDLAFHVYGQLKLIYKYLLINIAAAITN